MKTKHTPTPWAVFQCGLKPEIVHESGIVATVSGTTDSREETHANAQFITLACNHHEELVAALEVHASSLETCLASPTRAKIWREVAEINTKHLRSLLSKLKGQA